MKKVLLFGATGMAGHVVYYYLQSTGKYDISNVVYRTPLTEDSIIVDVTNRDAVADVVHRVHPEIIINCVGILIKGSREHPDNAILINAFFSVLQFGYIFPVTFPDHYMHLPQAFHNTLLTVPAGV